MMPQQPSVYNMTDIKWNWLMGIGVVMAILGALAIIFPAATSVSITVLLGILLLVGGVARFVYMFRSTGWGDFLLKLLVSIIYLAAGVLLLTRPIEGTLTLTLILGLFFVAQGIANMVISLVSSGSSGRGLLFFNGIVAFILGALIWGELPSSAAWAIGLLVGIYLLFDGILLMFASWQMHKNDDMMAPA